VQISLAISAYALQVPTWDNAVNTMIEIFGPNPGTVPALLEFLTVLPQELQSNTRIPITVRPVLFSCDKQSNSYTC
jgi:transportin-3